MVIVGLVGFLRLRMKYDRLVSWLMFFAAAFLFIDFSGRLLNSGRGGILLFVEYFPNWKYNH